MPRKRMTWSSWSSAATVGPKKRKKSTGFDYEEYSKKAAARAAEAKAATEKKREEDLMEARMQMRREMQEQMAEMKGADGCVQRFTYL